MTIEELFDPQKDIHRRIEKVITYAMDAEDKLRAEISEYVVTESIEQQLDKLLDKMDISMGSGENEVGVWVSGFYGSGKSSFTKYLGFAFDNTINVEGVPFRQRFQDRLHTPQVKARLGTVAQKYPATIIMVDLASNMLAGAGKADVSSVLYFNVLQWAGYSRNLKIAALEQRIEKDGRTEEFESKIAGLFPELTWKDLQNDPLAVDSIIPKIAHDMYPALFPSETSFSVDIADFQKTEEQQVEEMISLIRRKSGKDHIIFIVDEVGQYISSGENLILNLDGLAKNLKRIGDGKVWIMSTAQQTLTEDSARGAINNANLYKLKDRFPIQIDLEAHDIKEICIKRLLGKSPAGEEELGELFDRAGAGLRHNIKLENAKYYDADLDRKRFIDLYPFLPAHFDVLLHLLGQLAKSTGGFGLRSAIKIVQDILVDETAGKRPLAKEPIGTLVTTSTLFDALDKDIQKSFLQLYGGLTKTQIRFPNSKLHEDIAKTIVILQILDTIPITAKNIAALMHSSVSETPLADKVRQGIEELLADPQIPLSEKDGGFHFLSPKLSEIEKDRGELPLVSRDVSRISNEHLRSVFDPLPQTSVNGTRTVQAGLKVAYGNLTSGLAGESQPIQLTVQWTGTADYETAKLNLITESSVHSNRNTFYLLGLKDPKAEELAGEIYRCNRIVELHRSDPDQEVKSYRDDQQERATRLGTELERTLQKALSKGTFIFRGQNKAVSAIDSDLLAAAKKYLSEVATQVFDRYGEAPIKVDTDHAQKFLKHTNPATLTTALDPLSLFESVGGVPRFKSEHSAIVSINDFIAEHGTVEGKRILDRFTNPPFGWSADAIRYILAAMLLGGEIKINVSGNWIVTVGQPAIDVLKTNKSCQTAGFSLRDERPSNETLSRAAERLTKLTGETIVPLEQEIATNSYKKVLQLRNEYGSLAEKLTSLGLPGEDRMERLNREMTAVIDSDGGEGIGRLGAESSDFYDDLLWAGDVKRALSDGLEASVREIRVYRAGSESLPLSGIPGGLRRDMEEILDRVEERLKRDDFYVFAVELNSAVTDLGAKAYSASENLQTQLEKRSVAEVQSLAEMTDWNELTEPEKQDIISQIEGISFKASRDFGGFKSLLSSEYDFTARVGELKERVRSAARERILQRVAADRNSPGRSTTGKLTRTVKVSSRLTNISQLEELIRELLEIKNQTALYPDMEIDIELDE